MVELKCDNCEKIFKRKNYAIQKAKRRNQQYYYCSKKCTDEGKKRYSQIYKYCRNRLDELTPFRWYIRVSKYRDKELDIDEHYLKSVWEKQGGKCVYTKIPLTLWDYKVKGGNSKNTTASLDRIDSSKGYIKGNVQFISMTANLCKNTMTHTEVIDFFKLIAKNYYQDKDIVQI